MQTEASGRCYLAELSIVDFAVVQDLHLQLGPGLTVITGETGAGKSLIVDALGAALGERASADWRRFGAERAWVEAVFVGIGGADGLEGALAEIGCPVEDDLLVLRRELHPGRSLARVNGRAVLASTIEELRSRLVDVHSQGDQVGLLRPAAQLAALDRFGGLLLQRAQLSEALQRLLAVRAELRQLEEARRQVQREAALLQHEAAEIDAVAPVPGEDEELAATRQRLRNAVRIRACVDQALALLTGPAAESGDRLSGPRGALEQLGDALAVIRQLRELDPGFRFDEDKLLEAIDAVETALRGLVSYQGTLEADPAELERIEERLFSLAELRRKYGRTLSEVLAYRDQARERLRLLEDADERGERLRAEELEVARMAGQMALELSQAREQAARKLASVAEAQLSDLGMPHARLVVQVRQRPAADGVQLPGREGPLAFTLTGVDEVELLIAANPGEPARPLGRVASGGELARIMLAVRSAIAQADPVPVLVFDELDQGVGGRLGHVIGEKLWALARSHQVLCITHLPQVACYADAHYAVTKLVRDGRAAVSVRELGPEERVAELAAMLGGPRPGEGARRSAEELLAAADQWKRQAARPC